MFLEQVVCSSIIWRGSLIVFDEVAQQAGLLRAHRRLQAHRLLGDAEHLAHLADGEFEAAGQFLGGGLAAQFLLEQALGITPEAVTAGTCVKYYKDPAKAVSDLSSGAIQAGWAAYS